MLTWTDQIPYDFSDPVTARVFDRRAVFFDIETTGFSRAGSTVYLIGCATRDDDTLYLHQFFAQTPRQEAEIITAFSDLVRQYGTILTFNGNTFDIPYLQARCKFLHIEDSFSGHPCTDLYKETARLKHVLGLPSLKQKSIETFLGIDREDRYSGGELIEVYRDYVRQPTQRTLSILRQHNYEDVLYMPALLPVLSYHALFDGRFTVGSIEASEYTALEGDSRKELYFTLVCDVSVPKPLSCRHGGCYLSLSGQKAVLRVSLYEGTLRHYFDNPSAYYYLPAEDRAVLKTTARGVDRSCRKAATRSTCYTRKHAIFLPQYEDLITPVFREKPQSKGSYFELTEAFLSDSRLQHEYIHHLLRSMLRQKPVISG